MIYLSSPFTSEDPVIRRRRWFAACDATNWLLAIKEVPVFSPVAYGHFIERWYGRDYPYSLWMQLSLRTLSASSAMMILQIPGWDSSAGVATERVYALKLGIPITGIRPNENATVFELAESLS